MKTFYDYNGSLVQLSFKKNQFIEHTKHVLVICLHHDKWLLTKHKQRGLEFPGGKLEKGEQIVEAVYREVYEETGGMIDCLQWIADYKVSQADKPFVKAVYVAFIKNLIQQKDYKETDGPVLLEKNSLVHRFDKEFSFIMKDDVIKYCLEYIRKGM